MIVVVLQRLPRNIQRQVFGINQSPQESQIFRQKLAAFALHQHALRTKTETMIQPGKAEVLEIGRRTINDRAELDRRIRRHVQMPQRLLVGMMRQMLIKANVLLLGDLVLGLDPDRFLIVDDLAARTQSNRVRHEAGIALDDVLDPPVRRKRLAARPSGTASTRFRAACSLQPA